MDGIMTSLIRQRVDPLHVTKRPDTYRHRLLLKLSILFLLSVSNAAVVILTHYVRTRPGDMFVASTAVVMSEVVKVSTCLLATLILNPPTSLRDICSSFGNLKDWSKTAVPACIYAVQNNLVFFALSHLNSVIFQITYQLKILTTAVFSLFLLKKSLHQSQWLSLFLLFIGVVVVQMKGNNLTFTTIADHNKNLAICAVLTACILSGFASVYFEKILKSNCQTVWIRNIQLGIPSGLFAFLTMMATERGRIMSQGFFHGYDITVWFLILLQATGGLLVACVVKYTDNIMKTFAMAIAILISLVGSSLLFHTVIDLPMMVGSNIVIIAVFLYSLVK